MNLEFVDTNVLLYAYDPSSAARQKIAWDLLARLGRQRCGALSVQVLQEFFVNATCKLAKPLDPEQAAQTIRSLSRWPVHSPQPADVLAAINLAKGNSLSFWEAMIVNSASRLGCTKLWTEDLNAGQIIANLTIVNPFT